ncbi:MAG: acyl carrier protein [Bacteriovoracaceae bacterium]
MNRDEITNRVQDIFRDIFDEEGLEIKDETNADNIEDWDSLAQINLVSSIEKDLKVRFALGEIDTLKNVGEMINLIETKLK